MRFLSLALAALLLSSCGGSGTSTESASQSLIGAGATFPYPMYSKWFNEYYKQNPGVRINYQSLGSGAGIRQVTEGTVDFGASDGPMNEEQLGAFQEKRGSGVLHFPTVIGAVVPTYNLPEVTAPLNFTPEALVAIYLGKVTKWNDPAIASANPGVNLPAKDIAVVYRSDGSGTTYVWTDFLSKVSPEWTEKVGKSTSVNWPVGLGGKGSEGVAGQVKQLAYSLGYVEMNYAIQNKMATGRVKNAAGKFVEATLESVTAAAAGVPMPDDFRVSITNPAGEAAYPIASFTWLLIPEKIEDAAKREAIVGFLKWMLADGQQLTSTLDYAPLPAEVIAKETQLLAAIH